MGDYPQPLFRSLSARDGRAEASGIGFREGREGLVDPPDDGVELLPVRPERYLRVETLRLRVVRPTGGTLCALAEPDADPDAEPDPDPDPDADPEPDAEPDPVGESPQPSSQETVISP
jgi:hypothetical protein